MKEKINAKSPLCFLIYFSKSNYYTIRKVNSDHLLELLIIIFFSGKTVIRVHKTVTTFFFENQNCYHLIMHWDPSGYIQRKLMKWNKPNVNPIKIKENSIFRAKHKNNHFVWQETTLSIRSVTSVLIHFGHGNIHENVCYKNQRAYHDIWIKDMIKTSVSYMLG